MTFSIVKTDKLRNFGFILFRITIILVSRLECKCSTISVLYGQNKNDVIFL